MTWEKAVSCENNLFLLNKLNNIQNTQVSQNRTPFLTSTSGCLWSLPVQKLILSLTATTRNVGEQICKLLWLQIFPNVLEKMIFKIVHNQVKLYYIILAIETCFIAEYHEFSNLAWQLFNDILEHS